MSAQNRLVDGRDLERRLKALDGWAVADGHLRREFRFAGFPSAFAFMTRTAFDAERLNHHPKWTNVYNRVEVELWSHDLGGISELCFKLAEAMNRNAG
jgi:4a-hydroxytetrahydrobiopterin dehydratase